MTCSTGFSAWPRAAVRLMLSVFVVLPPLEKLVLSVLPSVTAVPSAMAMLVECAVAVLDAVPVECELAEFSALPHPDPVLLTDADPTLADEPVVRVGPPTQLSARSYSCAVLADRVLPLDREALSDALPER